MTPGGMIPELGGGFVRNQHLEKEFTKSPGFVGVPSQMRDVLCRRGLRTKPPPSLPGSMCATATRSSVNRVLGGNARRSDLLLARASLIALALASPAASPAWGGPDDYPPGLFERSPLNDTPAAVSRRGHSPSGQAKIPPSERASGACHHYRVWSYPSPQPC